MGKMHELLAVEPNLAGVFGKVLKEASVTFSKKTELFMGYSKRLRMFDEARRVEEAAASEDRTVTTSVDEKLAYIWEHVVPYLDLLAQKEFTNRNATGNLEVDGEIILENVPATLLLTIEQKLTKLREVYETIPTLTPGVNWIPADEIGRGVMKAEVPETTQKTENTITHKVLYDATDKHPAQIEKWTDKKQVGEYTTHKFSGMVTPRQKSDLLSKIDALIMAAKKGRMQANSAEVVSTSIGEKLYNFLHEQK